MHCPAKRHAPDWPSRSALCRSTPATTACADFWPRLISVRFSPASPDPPGKNAILHRTTAALRRMALGHESFAVTCLLALAGAASDAVRVPRLTVYALRLLPTLSHPHAVALRLPRCGQLGRGLPPQRSRPCCAHMKRAASRRPSILQRLTADQKRCQTPTAKRPLRLLALSVPPGVPALPSPLNLPKSV